MELDADADIASRLGGLRRAALRCACTWGGHGSFLPPTGTRDAPEGALSTRGVDAIPFFAALPRAAGAGGRVVPWLRVGDGRVARVEAEVLDAALSPDGRRLALLAADDWGRGGAAARACSVGGGLKAPVAVPSAADGVSIDDAGTLRASPRAPDDALNEARTHLLVAEAREGRLVGLRIERAPRRDATYAERLREHESRRPCADYAGELLGRPVASLLAVPYDRGWLLFRADGPPRFFYVDAGGDLFPLAARDEALRAMGRAAARAGLARGLATHLGGGYFGLADGSVLAVRDLGGGGGGDGNAGCYILRLAGADAPGPLCYRWAASAGSRRVARVAVYDGGYGRRWSEVVVAEGPKPFLRIVESR